MTQTRKRSAAFVPALVAELAIQAAAQGGQAPAAPLDLRAAVAQASERYPAIAEARARASAAEAGVDLAKTTYLPRLDLLWQENRATHNNIFGMLLPQNVVPSISGPVTGTTSLDSVWGSAGGLLLSWEPIDFGQRRAAVDFARAQTRAARAQESLTQLAVETNAADAFLSLLAAGETLRAAQANVDRLDVFARAVHVLVDNQLRPGAEASRADAELAAARNQLALAAQARDLAQAALADAVGAPGTPIAIDAGTLPEAPADLPAAPPVFAAHPAADAQAAAVSSAEARERVVERGYFPRLNLQGAFSGRGSGAKVSPSIFEGTGLWLQVPNWAAGVTVTFPALDLFSTRARERVEAGNRAAEQAKYEQTIQNLKTQAARADAVLTAARAIAANAPVELQAAREAATRARARYDAGLASVTEVAEAQRLLAQAESDAAVSTLAVWRALLAEASLRGDLGPFLARAHR